LILNINLFAYLFNSKILHVQLDYRKVLPWPPIPSTGEALPSFELEVTLTFTHFPDARFSDFLIDDNY